MKKISTLTLVMLGFGVLIAGIFAWPKMDNEPKKSQEAFIPMPTVHTAGRERVSEGKPGISSEVQRRLAAAGFKTDSFTAVKTETRKKSKTTNIHY